MGIKEPKPKSEDEKIADYDQCVKEVKDEYALGEMNKATYRRALKVCEGWLV